MLDGRRQEGEKEGKRQRVKGSQGRYEERREGERENEKKGW
jgi:hypothetical protein